LDEAKEVLRDGLAGIDMGIGDVQRFLVTHVHRDHYTQAVVLRREFGTDIALGKGEQPTLDRINNRETNEPFFIGRLRAAGAVEMAEQMASMPRPSETERSVWEQPDEWLADRATAKVGARELTAIHTPGHTRGHLVFSESSTGLLFAGDHVLPHITPS